MQKKWKKITSDYVDDEAICYIDAWKETEEQGKTIAWVDTLSGRVIYNDPEARTDAQAQEVIEKVVGKAKKEHPYSVERLEDLLKDVINYECEEIGSGVDVQMNLYSMGFTEEEMIFFGYPPCIE